MLLNPLSRLSQNPARCRSGQHLTIRYPKLRRKVRAVDVDMRGILILEEHQDPESTETPNLRHPRSRTIRREYRAEFALAQYQLFFRRSANFAPTNENTSSPCWLVP